MRESINKTTVIIVLAVFLTLSVGYALFSDTITIEGTATAQGNFDLTATCNTGVSQELVNAGLLEPVVESKEARIEKLMEQASQLYNEGKKEEAAALYEEISKINSE